ncbi:MAG TPA: sensor histidine kinase, partial [Ruminococcaceae bacterium]|nr:sensor histidine kinase [Oscillospiraceae bacterium]
MASDLEQLESSRRSFVANVSHELKTPMTTIGGFIDGMLDGTIPPEKQSYYLSTVSSEIKRLSRMVVSMLNLSKIEAGQLDLKFAPVDVQSLLIESTLNFEKQIE